MAVAWCLTGGGAYLREVVDYMVKIKRETNAKVTVFFTKWGYEVARIFGVLQKIRLVAGGGYYEEILVGDEGMYYIGRLNRRRYSVVVIAPATSNTIAKIVHGIADSVASAIFSQAVKSGVPVVVLPTDMPNEKGVVVTETPCYIDRNICLYTKCGRCSAQEACSVKAIKIVDGLPRIDLGVCIGCGVCVHSCIYGAVKCWEKVELRPRETDLRNIELLKKIEKTYVVSSPEQLYKTVKRIVFGGD
ncbi:flavoprotein [Ignisphaera sp. 4213-co]|uniref:Flavoprotein n=1 Tax=Ignisphaera cupida TaxID=3050454 RepID=A0ABD4Z864_9CREN|nr:flavoprotein [Ignisphaera sp. 4213-co]MDK6029202.1 flavoprotein [Ignisphaera sp. 4213-co]